MFIRGVDLCEKNGGMKQGRTIEAGRKSKKLRIATTKNAKRRTEIEKQVIGEGTQIQ